MPRPSPKSLAGWCGPWPTGSPHRPKGIGLEPDIAMSGGVAKNQGMFAAMEEVLGVKINRLDGDPQLNGALGAALLAEEMLGNNISFEQ